MERASEMLAEADTIQKVKEFKSVALTAADWARRRRLGADVVQRACSYATRAEIKLGEMLAATERAGGALRKGNSPAVTAGDHGEPAPTLADLGVSKRESAEAQALAALPPERREAVISGELTKAEVLREVRAEKRAEKLADISAGNQALPVGKRRYSVIYADPPWRYEEGSTTSNRIIENHYPTMILDDIKRLPVVDIAEPNCALFLWATPPKLDEAMSILPAWGFTYRTCAVWVKDRIGMGYWFRQQHEMLLVATRGSISPPAPSDRVSSVISAAREEHSVKPVQVYELIERTFPAPRMEMFARSQRPGWDSWGNQA